MPMAEKKPIPSTTTWHKEDFILGGILLGGITALVVLVLCLPAGTIDIGAATKWLASAVEQKKSGTEVETARESRGIFVLGRVVVNVGNSNAYLDSDVNLEFDRDALSENTNGEVDDKPKAQYFFEKRRAIIKDTIITMGSEFTPDAMASRQGIEDFKSDIVSSVNLALAQNVDLVTGVFFDSFLVMPPDES